MGRLLLIALRNLRQNTRRTLLLGGAMLSVTALLVVLMSVSNGIQDTMLRTATTLATGHVNIAGFFKVTSGQAAPVVTHYAPLLELAREKVPEATLIVDRLRGWAKVVSPTNSMQLGIGGIDVENETGLDDVVQVTRGSLADLKGPDAVLIFEHQAERLEVDVGDDLTLSAPTVRGSYNSIDVRVVAVAKDIGMISGFNIFSTKEVVRRMYTMDARATGAIHVYLSDPDDSAAVAARLRAAISEAGYEVMDPLNQPFWQKFPLVSREPWTGQRIDVTTWEDEMAFLTWTRTAFDSLTFALVAVLLIIILIGVTNSMWMAIRERTREIGTLRAIGMPRRTVLAMFVVEAAALSLIATTLGALLGALVAFGLNALEIELSAGFQLFLMRETLRLVVAPGGALVASLIITTVVTLVSMYPASRAARMRPVTAMHHVG